MTYFQVIAEPANIAGKLVMGIPTYGRTFLLSDASQNTPGSAASGAMPAGPISGDWSYLAYHEVREICIFSTYSEFNPCAARPVYYTVSTKF